MSRQRSRFTPPSRRPAPKKSLTKKELQDSLLSLAEQAEDEISATHIRKLADSINSNSFVPYDAELTASTVSPTNVAVQPRPPEKDPLLAAIVGKEPPVEKPSLEAVQKAKAKPKVDGAEMSGQEPKTPQELAKAYEDALAGKESKPAMELVESSAMLQAESLLKMDSRPPVQLAGLSKPVPGQVWESFRKFVK